jgi:site-specific recombinase XerC
MGRPSGLGLCHACYQRSPHRVFSRVNGLIDSLDNPPHWLADFAEYIVPLHCASRACSLVSSLGRLLRNGEPAHPQSLLERSRRSGRSMGTLARALQDFFILRRLAMPTDQPARLAAGRRQRRVNSAPAQLRAAVGGFAEHLMRQRERALRAGTRPRSDSTVESRISIIRDLATFLHQHQNKTDWATVSIADVEAFLASGPPQRKSRLGAIRQFFSFARHKRLILVDPAKGLSAREPRGFRGKTVSLPMQRRLFRRWTGAEPHPHEALVGLLSLLHGTSSREIRGITIDDIEIRNHAVQLGQRPAPTALDPASWAAMQRCLLYRQGQDTGNPHVIVTRGTKARLTPASGAYLSHVLDPAGVAPRFLRNTRLLDLVSNLDPKMVAAAFGMEPEAALHYLIDAIDPTRMPEHV